MISMLKEFVFVIIIISAYFTWHSTFLFQKTETWETNGKNNLSSNALLAADKNNDTGNTTGQDEDSIMDEDKFQVTQETEQNQVNDTCSALGHCICALGLCFRGERIVF